MRISPHGTSAGYRGGCRCEGCVTANCRDHRMWRERRTARLKADPSIREHGNAYTYQGYGCRCYICTVAHNLQRHGYTSVPFGREWMYERTV